MPFNFGGGGSGGTTTVNETIVERGGDSLIHHALYEDEDVPVIVGTGVDNGLVLPDAPEDGWSKLQFDLQFEFGDSLEFDADEQDFAGGDWGGVSSGIYLVSPSGNPVGTFSSSGYSGFWWSTRGRMHEIENYTTTEVGRMAEFSRWDDPETEDVDESQVRNFKSGYTVLFQPDINTLYLGPWPDTIPESGPPFGKQRIWWPGSIGGPNITSLLIIGN